MSHYPLVQMAYCIGFEVPVSFYEFNSVKCWNASVGQKGTY